MPRNRLGLEVSGAPTGSTQFTGTTACQTLLDRRRRAQSLDRILRKLFGIGKPKNLQGGSGLAAIMQLAMIAAQITLTTLEASGAARLGEKASLPRESLRKQNTC